MDVVWNEVHLFTSEMMNNYESESEWLFVDEKPYDL